MSLESGKYIRIIPAPHGHSAPVLNLRTLRIEAFGTHGLNDGKVTTLQSGGTRMDKDNVVALRDAPKRLLKNLIPFLFNVPVTADESKAA